jgi:TPR repeat protein
MHSHGRGGAEDLVEARRLICLAAAQGHGGAQFHLAVMHEQGRGGPKDEAEARRLYSLAAAQGHPIAQANLDAMRVQAAAQRSHERSAAEATQAAEVVAARVLTEGCRGDHLTRTS